MTIDEIHRKFEVALATWVATKVMVFDNVGDEYVPVKGEAWTRFTINWYPSVNRALGTKTSREGIATLQIFTPLNVGPRVASKIADAYLDILENKEFGNIFTYAGSTTRIGDDGRGWYQLNADITFQAT